MTALDITHKARLGAIALFLVLDVAALIAVHYGVAPSLIDSVRPTVEAVCSALALAALPALADAIRVEQRRRDPEQRGLVDDVLAEDRKDGAQ